MRYRLTNLGGMVMDTRGILDQDDRPQQPHYDTDVPNDDGDGNDHRVKWSISKGWIGIGYTLDMFLIQYISKSWI
jgi:hypothetical protein